MFTDGMKNSVHEIIADTMLTNRGLTPELAHRVVIEELGMLPEHWENSAKLIKLCAEVIGQFRPLLSPPPGWVVSDPAQVLRCGDVVWDYTDHNEGTYRVIAQHATDGWYGANTNRAWAWAQKRHGDLEPWGTIEARLVFPAGWSSAANSKLAQALCDLATSHQPYDLSIED